MDPYRDGGMACPSCGTALRAIGGRLICDACGGMMMPIADFAASIVDLGASAVEVVTGSDVPRGCPRCGGALAVSVLEVDRRSLKTTVVGCAHHGLWFDSGVLERAYTEIGRRSSKGRGRPISEDGSPGGFWLYPTKQRLLPREQTFRPRVRTRFASALADRTLACPTCHGRLQLRGMLWTCDDHGVFVEHDVLAAMVAEMTNAPWDAPPWLGEEAGARRCPACDEGLASGELGGTTVERCATHGFWLSATDLESVLGRLGKPPAKSWLGRWLS